MKKFKHKLTGKIFEETDNGYYYHLDMTESVPYYIIKDSTDWEEVIKIPEYVECIHVWSNGAKESIIGKIYKTSEIPDFSSFPWSTLLKDTFFTPSNKEAYEAQFIPDYTGVCFKTCKGTYYKIGSKFSVDNHTNHYLEVGNQKKFTYHSTEDIYNLLTDKTWIEVPLEEYEAKYFPKVKEYEILSFETNLAKLKYTLRETGEYIHESKPVNFGGWLLKDMLEDNSAHIHSIKRLSDNCIFTVGDSVNTGKIQSIEINDAIKGGVKLVTPDSYICIRLAKHAVKLFTTEDGVDIFEGDSCWYCLPRGSFKGRYTLEHRKCNGTAKEGKYFYLEKAALDYIRKNLIVFTTKDGVGMYYNDSCVAVLDDFTWHAFTVTKNAPNPNLLYFSCLETAEKYIKLYKPNYSLADIYIAYERYKHICFTTDDFINKLSILK